MKSSLQKFGPYLIFFAAMLWATDAPFRLHLTKDLPSNLIVLGEHFFDTLIALPILFWGRAELKKLNWRGWLAIILVAIGGSALASLAFTEAFHYVNPSVAILLQKLQPLVAISFAVSLLREKLPKFFWVWSALAIFGAYIISFPKFTPELYAGEVWNPNTLGVLLSLVAVLFWGASTVLGKYALASVSFKTMTALRFCIAFLFLFCLNVSQGSLGAIGKISRNDWFYIFIIAVTSGIVSLFIYYKGLTYTKASVATIAELGFPVAAVLVNVAFIPNSTINAIQIQGMLLLLGAVYFLTRVESGSEELKKV